VDIKGTARGLVDRYGAKAVGYAEVQAIEDLLCGDAERSTAWELIIDETERLLKLNDAAEDVQPCCIIRVQPSPDRRTVGPRLFIVG
jgi:hypothetical protein